MQTVRKQILVAAALAGALMLATTGARAEDINTRIGTLSFTHDFANGYPTKATVEKLYDERDFQRACQVYLWALPMVSFGEVEHVLMQAPGAAHGDILSLVAFPDLSRFLTANATTPYTLTWLNLAKSGPYVIELPAGLIAGFVNDLWQRPVTDLGLPGPDKGRGGKFLILAPGAPDPMNSEFITVRSKSNQIWFATRGLGADLAVAEATVRKYKLYAYDERPNPPATKFIPVGDKTWSSEQPRDLKYWQYLHDVLALEVPEERDRFFHGMMLPLGIVQGKPFTPTESQKKVLTEAAVVGDLLGRLTAYSKRVEGTEVWKDKHWEYALMVELDQTYKGYGQIDERGSWFYEAIGNTVGMQGRTLGFGQLYLEAQKDKTGAWLDGGKNYHLHVPPNPPVELFWSFTIYDNLTRGPMITPQGAADISSRTKGLEVNADGSVDLYFGPQKPPGANANYVMTMPKKGWFTYFRFYGPKEAYFDKSWQLPDMEEVK